eukprot:7378542-Prymnesium_polylepis.2
MRRAVVSHARSPDCDPHRSPTCAHTVAVDECAGAGRHLCPLGSVPDDDGCFIFEEPRGQSDGRAELL